MIKRASFTGLLSLVSAAACMFLIGCVADQQDVDSTPDADATAFAGSQAQSFGGSPAPIVAQPEPEPAPMPSEPAIEQPAPQSDAGAPVTVEPKPALTAGTVAPVSAAGSGAAGSVAGTNAAGTGAAGMGGSGGSAAPVGVTKCKLASKQVIACDAFSAQYFPSWVVIWTVAQGAGSVTYNCTGAAPKCVAGSKCTVAHVDTGTSEMGVCQ